MLKRISLVWKRPELSMEAFRRIWLGEHVEYAQRLAGLRGYEIAFRSDDVPGMPDGIAMTLFDSRTACEAAFSDPEILDGLTRTRADFAERVIVSFVDDVKII